MPYKSAYNAKIVELVFLKKMDSKLFETNRMYVRVSGVFGLLGAMCVFLVFL